jgi:hypothetical protein
VLSVIQKKLPSGNNIDKSFFTYGRGLIGYWDSLVGGAEPLASHRKIRRECN